MAIFIRFSSPLFCLFFFFSLSSHKTMSQAAHIYTFCDISSENFTQTSPYKSNRQTLLSSLTENSPLKTYSNATIGLSPDTVYGMFLCRGDITKTSCSDCVKNATLELTSNNCTYQKEAIIYYEECMVRYSSSPFFGLVEYVPLSARYSSVSFPTSLFNTFHSTLSKKVDQLIILTASKSSLSSSTPYYVRDRDSVYQYDGSYTLDTMVQCSPDLDPSNCSVCLRLAVQTSSLCCHNSRIAQIFLPKCFLKYDTSGLPTDQSPSGSHSIHVMKGKEIFGRICITTILTTLVLALGGL